MMFTYNHHLLKKFQDFKARSLTNSVLWILLQKFPILVPDVDDKQADQAASRCQSSHENYDKKLDRFKTDNLFPHYQNGPSFFCQIIHEKCNWPLRGLRTSTWNWLFLYRRSDSSTTWSVRRCCSPWANHWTRRFGSLVIWDSHLWRHKNNNSPCKKFTKNPQFPICIKLWNYIVNLSKKNNLKHIDNWNLISLKFSS